MSYLVDSVPDVSEPGDVPPEILDRLRPICLGLPETYEEPAWVGIRWRIRKRTFAHVLTVDQTHQRVWGREPSHDEPVCLMTFRAAGEELEALVSGGHPFFKASWGENVVGIVFEDDVDWDEIAELLTDSYCVLAPKRLAVRVERLAGPP
jgi:hypothetical protein